MYSQTGNYVAAAGVVVTLLSYLGVNATIDQIAQILAGIAIVYGIVHQYFSHRNLAQATGTLPKPSVSQ